MATNYPTQIDEFGNPTATSSTVVISHASQHANANDAIEAIETKLGADSSADTGSIDYKLTNASSSNPGHKHTLANGATDVTASAAELNVLDGIPATLTATELGYVDGVTSAIQTQLNAKLASSDLTTHESDTTTHGATGAVVGTTNTQTLTEKRITPRVSTEASSATPTINTDNVDMHTITAQAEAITSFTSGLSGTPTNGQKLIIRILDNGTARAITWGASFASRGATLPTTTVLGKYQYNGFIWNSTSSTWDCVASVNEA